MTLSEDPTQLPKQLSEPLLTPHPPTPTTTPYLSLNCGYSSSRPGSEAADSEDKAESAQKAVAADCLGLGFLTVTLSSEGCSKNRSE
jgi:hypothetical protein